MATFWQGKMNKVQTG